jgi:hypothetical protein
MRLLAGLLTSLAVVAAATLTASQPTTQTLDFVAVDANGKPVTDLTSAELKLKIGGKVRPLVNLEHVTQAAGGRRILLLLEEATLYNLEPVVRDGVKTLLASLRPDDEVTLISTRQSSAPVIRGREAVARAVESLNAGPGTLHSCLADTLTNIEAMAARLPRGRASTLVVIGRGNPEGAASGPEGDAAPCTPRRDALRKTAEKLADAQINVVMLTVHETNRSWGYDTIAANIGATTGLLTWADTDALARVVSETASFYRASFAVDSPVSAVPQRVDLKTTRRKVQLRTSPVLTLGPETKLTSNGIRY